MGSEWFVQTRLISGNGGVLVGTLGAVDERLWGLELGVKQDRYMYAQFLVCGDLLASCKNNFVGQRLLLCWRQEAPAVMLTQKLPPEIVTCPQAAGSHSFDPAKRGSHFNVIHHHLVVTHF